jgi:hypothetical protein
MTSYSITTKTDTKTVLAAVTIGVETTVIDVPAQAADYIIESYIDLTNMAGGDTTNVTEYVGVDGSNLRVYQQVTYSGAQTAPILRFHGKLFEKDLLYRITIKQTAGTGRAYPYASVLQVFNA